MNEKDKSLMNEKDKHKRCSFLNNSARSKCNVYFKNALSCLMIEHT